MSPLEFLRNFLSPHKKNSNSILYPIVSVLLAFVAAGLLLLLLDMNPVLVYWNMLTMTFSDIYLISEILVKAIPLMLAALSFAFAFRASLFNIGIDGQFYMGALVAVVFSLYLHWLPTALLMLLILIGSIILGGLWGGIAGYLKAKYNANEIIITIMLNYVAFQIVNYLVDGPLKEKGAAYPQTDPIPKDTFLPILVENTRLHVGLLIALVFVLIFWFVLNKTTLGFRVRATGLNNEASRYAGMKPKRVIFLSLAITGSFAGIAGFIEINGVQHILIQGFAPNVGGEGTVIALLANTNPIGIVLGSFLFGFLKVSANVIQQTSKVPTSAVRVIEGFVVIFVLGSYYIQELVNRRRLKKAMKEEVS